MSPLCVSGLDPTLQDHEDTWDVRVRLPSRASIQLGLPGADPTALLPQKLGCSLHLSLGRGPLATG